MAAAAPTNYGRMVMWRFAGMTFGAAAGVVACGYMYPDLGCKLMFDAASATGPIVRLLDAETSHQFGIFSAKMGLFPQEFRPEPEILKTTVWGRTFQNPIGLAAGFDKDAEAVPALLRLGFGFVEAGSITPLPQPGNPKPRSFRLAELGGAINRFGFNSKGVDNADANLEKYRNYAGKDEYLRKRILGVNIGKNKTTEDAAADYCIGINKLARHADFLVVNVSSPNTPGLRKLQGRKQLDDLVKRVKKERDAQAWGPEGPPPLLVKIAPDLTEQDKADIAQVATSNSLDGLVISNTTISRPDSIQGHPNAKEEGGLSGKPMFEMSTEVLSDMYKLTRGRIPIIGCGGVASGEDAYKKIRAGASLVEVYTAMAYQGPSMVPNMKYELAKCLERDGFESVADAVGADHKDSK